MAGAAPRQWARWQPVLQYQTDLQREHRFISLVNFPHAAHGSSPLGPVDDGATGDAGVAGADDDEATGEAGAGEEVAAEAADFFASSCAVTAARSSCSTFLAIAASLSFSASLSLMVPDAVRAKLDLVVPEVEEEAAGESAAGASAAGASAASFSPSDCRSRNKK